MSRYQNGKIYEITSASANTRFIGSTTDDLKLRLSKDKYYNKDKDNILYNKVIKHTDVKISLLEKFPCDTLQELLDREKEWTDLNPTAINRYNIKSELVKNAPNYQNSKIYQITSPSTNKRYIGSTTRKLEERFYRHKNKKQYISSFEIIKFGDAVISLLENFPCNSKQELIQREAQWIAINIMTCVNIQMPGRTKAQYAADNKEHIYKRASEYNNKHKERIREVKKKYRHKNKEKIK
ncbi:MAG: hypothetical protein Faunusvirus14_4 [Faunusvirus sp.]|jgi:hypothetical protein|uniref:GIY-YIG domain-containing protein n=1 Tax=Faunusvirus sp. TaxID=2487766 RepID=A0A3G4ZX07_9VIRU|nr:MAG: hypothetical protein Faunusvirus14_4 [Faunusvirus sp.]